MSSIRQGLEGEGLREKRKRRRKDGKEVGSQRAHLVNEPPSAGNFQLCIVEANSDLYISYKCSHCLTRRKAIGHTHVSVGRWCRPSGLDHVSFTKSGCDRADSQRPPKVRRDEEDVLQYSIV